MKYVEIHTLYIGLLATSIFGLLPFPWSFAVWGTFMQTWAFSRFFTHGWRETDDRLFFAGSQLSIAILTVLFLVIRSLYLFVVE